MLDVNIMPFAKLMGIRIVEADPDKVVGEMLVREDLCTTNSILHGGAFMALADTIGAVATVLNLPKGAGTTTVESKTNFICALKAGEIAGGMHAHPPGQDDAGLADANPAVRRQARRDSHADAARSGAPRVIGGLIRALSLWRPKSLGAT